jgi:hypothetical protein
MQYRFNAKTQSREDAKEEGENGCQTNVHRLVNWIGRVNFFFAPWRLRAFALKSSHLNCMDTAKRQHLGRQTPRKATPRTISVPARG